MLAFIEEENFFTCLTWLNPALSGIIVSILLGESILDSNQSHTSSAWGSCCSKRPIHWEEFARTIVNNVCSLSLLTCVCITFVVQILLVIRRRQLEKQVADGIMVVIYNMDGVSISRRTPDQLSCQKLQRHNRMVVTPQASSISFMMSLLVILLQGKIFHFMGPRGLPIYVQFLVFSTFSQVFFLYTFLETILSPTLRNSLTDVFPQWRRQYLVVHV